jgi:hypothetical protein
LYGIDLAPAVAIGVQPPNEMALQVASASTQQADGEFEKFEWSVQFKPVSAHGKSSGEVVDANIQGWRDGLPGELQITLKFDAPHEPRDLARMVLVIDLEPEPLVLPALEFDEVEIQGVPCLQWRDERPSGVLEDTDFDTLFDALREAKPTQCEWLVEEE